MDKKNAQNWEDRHRQLITDYDIDFLWFDGALFPHGEHGKKVCTEFFNNSLNENGKVECIVGGKFWGISEAEQKGALLDFERGIPEHILERPWQSIFTSTSWFYDNYKESRMNAKVLIEMFADIISKNGNMLLNIELLPDGSIPKEQKDMFDEIGEWMNINADAIYSSHNWLAFGDNLGGYVPDRKATISDQTKSGDDRKDKVSFRERTKNSPAYDPSEVRFTVVDDKLYIIVLEPSVIDLKIPVLGLKSANGVKKAKGIRQLGNNNKVDFEQNDDCLVIKVTEDLLTKYASVYEIKGIL